MDNIYPLGLVDFKFTGIIVNYLIFNDIEATRDLGCFKTAKT